MDPFISLHFCFQYPSLSIYNCVRHYEPNSFIVLPLLPIFLWNIIALTFFRCTNDKITPSLKQNYYQGKKNAQICIIQNTTLKAFKLAIWVCFMLSKLHIWVCQYNLSSLIVLQSVTKTLSCIWYMPFHPVPFFLTLPLA